MNNNENQIKTGLWATQSKNGNEYFTGKVTLEGKTYRIAMFINNKKLSEKSPDYNLSFSGMQQPTQTTEKDPLEEFETGVVLSEDDLPF